MSNQREVRQIKARELRVVTNESGQRTLSGYAAVFNSLSVDMGGWFEIISTSAFTRTLQESPDVLCLYSHDASLVLGRTKSATLTLAIDSTGLRFDCVLPDTSTANDLIVSIERGDVDGCSFGFVCQSDVWAENSEGRVIRTLLDVDLYEVTITAAPAYPDTSIALRSAPMEVRSRLEKRDDISDTETSSVLSCDCTCPECVDGDCANCSDADCTDANCTEDRSTAPVETLALRIRLALLRKK